MANFCVCENSPAPDQERWGSAPIPFPTVLHSTDKLANSQIPDEDRPKPAPIRIHTILHSVDKPADSQIQDQGSNYLHSIKSADDESMKKFSDNKITVLYTDTINPCSALSDKTMISIQT